LTIIVFDCDLRLLVTHSVSFSVSYCCDDKKNNKKTRNNCLMFPHLSRNFRINFVSIFCNVL